MDIKDEVINNKLTYNELLELYIKYLRKKLDKQSNIPSFDKDYNYYMKNSDCNCYCYALRLKIPKYFTKPNPKKLQRRLDYYKQNKKFEAPIVIDSNCTLIDGYTSYLIAKNYNKTSVIAHLKRDKKTIL